MVETTYDVVAVGNAIVDVLARVGDGFLEERDLKKGSMSLVDAKTAGTLYTEIDPDRQCSGGSAANTVAGIASLGGTPAFIGKIHKDELGGIFKRDIASAGVEFATEPLKEGPSTARCIILVTTDAERTMNTYLGACTKLTPDDIDENVIKAGKIIYLEGYLWDEEDAKQAMLKACRIAKENEKMVAFTLSDSFCVERHREEFLELIKEHVDILFCNEDEILSLYQAKKFDTAINKVKKDCSITAITRQDKGSVVVSGVYKIHVEAEQVEEVVDTTGAGDLYAAGFLHGLVNGRSLGTCARIGGITAGEVITHYGARPETVLRGLVRKKIDPKKINSSIKDYIS
jgi:sugar/nucleoside kinase (ribokinase family)